MSLYDLFPEADANQADEMLRQVPQPRLPGFLEGSLTAIPRGLASGTAKGAELLEAMGATNVSLTGIPTSMELPGQTPPSQALSPPEDSPERDAARQYFMKQFRQDPNTNGFISNLLFGLSDVGVRALSPAGPWGAVAQVAATGGFDVTKQSEAEGIDPQTARRLGTFSGLTEGAALVLPFGIGSSAIAKLTTGAVTNTAFGMGERYVNSRILSDAGYTEQAKQYRVLEAQAVLTDALMGTFFGGGAYLHDRMAARGEGLPPSVGDAALTSTEQLHVEASADGVPRTPEAANNHLYNFGQTLEALIEGREPQDLRPVETVPNPAQEAATREATKTVAEAVGEYGDRPGEPDVDAGENLGRMPEDLADRLQAFQDEVRATREAVEQSQLSRSARRAQAEREAAKAVGQLDEEAQEPIAAAQQHLAENPELKVNDPDVEGADATSGSDMLRGALDDVKNAPLEGEIAKVAAACFGRE